MLEVIKGKEKLCQKTIKESVKTTHQLLVNIFKIKLPTYFQHLANKTNTELFDQSNKT